MKISAPCVRRDGESVIVSAEFQTGDHQDILWFRLPAKYQDYVVTERSDSFLVGLLAYAMVRGEDIHLEGPVSEKIYYQVSNYLIPALTLANSKFQRIEIVPGKLENHSLNTEGAVGTGFSGGVDSFCTIHDHLVNPKCPTRYRLTHLTFFNVGSHGDLGGDQARAVFNKRLQILKGYPEECGLNFLAVDSNLSEVLQMNFAEAHSLRNMAAVLLLQKLFRVYYYSSAYRMDDFRIKNAESDPSPYDILNMAMLSTESTDLYSSGTQYTRVEKTALISDYEPTWRYLNVCTCDDRNCSACYKCMRTMFTLELLGKLNNYAGIFNFGEYFRLKERYVGQIVAKNTEYFYKDIFNEMTSRAVQVSATSRLFALKYRWALSWRKISRRLNA